MNSSRAVELLELYLAGELPDSEAAAVETWLRDDPAAPEIMARSKGLVSQLNASLQPPAGADEFALKIVGALDVEVLRRTRSRRKVLSWAAGLAAAASLLLAVTVLQRPSTGTGKLNTAAGRSSDVLSGNVLVNGAQVPTVAEGSTVSVAGETLAVVRLTDGSRAELEPATSAVLHGRAQGMRQLIELVKGGGTFRVEHAQGDFRVVTKLGSVTAVGTEFSVRILPPHDLGETRPGASGSGASGMKSCGATLAVAVLVGTVQVEFGGRTLLLHRGENCVFGDDQAVPATAPAKVPSTVAATSVPTGKTLEIKLGAAINRSWDDVKQAGYAYGGKQEFDAVTHETHIWLPYGNKGVYFETVGVRLTEPGSDGTGSPEVHTLDGGTSGRLVFKLHFDKPIGGFRFAAGWSEWGMEGDTVGGIEYSVDGQKWTSIRQTHEAKIIEPFVAADSFDAKGLKTRDLYIRCYSRDKNHPEADFGPGRWMKFRLAGDPAWGDAASTFFQSQMQLWVTPAN